MRRTLILYAEWSNYDRDLVSDLQKMISENVITDEFHFVEVSVIKTMSEFEKYIPGIGPVYQTPAIGVWDGETLLYRGTGFHARQYLREMYRLEVGG